MMRPAYLPWCPVPEVLAAELMERLGPYDAAKLADELRLLIEEMAK